MNTSPFDLSILQAFGLSERERAIYLAALEFGESLQVPLANKVGMKRTSLRELLPNLLYRGILQEVVRGKRRYILARDPRELVAELERRTQEARNALPSLMALQNNLREKPKVRFFEGVEGVKHVYEETLRVAQPLYSFVEVSTIHPEIEDWLVRYYVPRRNAKQIKNYVLVNEWAGVEELIPTGPFRLNRIVPSKEFPFRMEILIFGDYVAFVHFRKTESPSATLIQSQAAATTLRSAHQYIWYLTTQLKTTVK